MQRALCDRPAGDYETGFCMLCLAGVLVSRIPKKMDREAELEVIRRAYAKQIMAAAGVSDRRLEAAFATAPREQFLGPGPWQIVRWEQGYVPTPSANPVYIYDDVVVAILPERTLNNGQPSLQPRCWAPQPRNPASTRCISVSAAVITQRFLRGLWVTVAVSPRSSSTPD